MIGRESVVRIGLWPDGDRLRSVRVHVPLETCGLFIDILSPLPLPPEIRGCVLHGPAEIPVRGRLAPARGPHGYVFDRADRPLDPFVVRLGAGEDLELVIDPFEGAEAIEAMDAFAEGRRWTVTAPRAAVDAGAATSPALRAVLVRRPPE